MYVQVDIILFIVFIYSQVIKKQWPFGMFLMGDYVVSAWSLPLKTSALASKTASIILFLVRLIRIFVSALETEFAS